MLNTSCEPFHAAQGASTARFELFQLSLNQFQRLQSIEDIFLLVFVLKLMALDFSDTVGHPLTKNMLEMPIKTVWWYSLFLLTSDILRGVLVVLDRLADQLADKDDISKRRLKGHCDWVA